MHDDAFYVPKELFEEWARRDPIERFRGWLRDNAEMTDDEEDEITAGVKRLLNEAIQRAEESPLPDPATRDRGRLRDARRARHAAPPMRRALMAEKTYLQAISDGLRQEMRRDQRVFVLGEDVGVYGGAFKVTQGFQEEFGAVARARHAALRDGDRRRRDRRGADGHAPGRGDAVRRLRLLRVGPPRHGRREAVLPRRHADPDRRAAPLRRRLLGRAVPLAEPRVELSRTSPGSRSSARRRREDAKGLLATAIEDPNPVLFFEHKHLYRRIKGEVPDDRYTIAVRRGAHPPRGRRRHRDHVGRDGLHGGRGRGRSSPTRASRSRCSTCARCIPWDQEAVLESVAALLEGARPPRGHAGRAASARRSRRRSPRRPSSSSTRRFARIAAPDSPVPFSPTLEKAYIPQVDDVATALRELAAY